MKRLTAILFVIMALAAAVVQAEEPAQPVQKLVAVKHVQTSDPRVSGLMNTLGVRATGPVGGYIVLNGPKEAVAAAEEVLQKMDAQKAEPDVELTGWILAAPHGETDLQTVPTVLEGVAKQLKAAFGYSNLRLLTSFVVRTHANSQGRTRGLLSPMSLGSKTPGDAVVYDFDFRTAEVISGNATGRTIRLSGISLALRAGMKDVQIGTNVDLNEGQKVVIGKTSVAEPAEELPLLLVLSARVIE